MIPIKINPATTDFKKYWRHFRWNNLENLSVIFEALFCFKITWVLTVYQWHCCSAVVLILTRWHGTFQFILQLMRPCHFEHTIFNDLSCCGYLWIGIFRPHKWPKNRKCYTLSTAEVQWAAKNFGPLLVVAKCLSGFASRCCCQQRQLAPPYVWLSVPGLEPGLPDWKNEDNHSAEMPRQRNSYNS